MITFSKQVTDQHKNNWLAPIAILWETRNDLR